MNPVESVLAHARGNPAGIAIASADFVMTYGELGDSVVRFAARLRRLGVGRGAVVAVTAHPGIEAVVTFALLHEGAIALAGTPAVLRAYADTIDVVISDRAVLGAKRLIVIDSEFLAALGSVSVEIEPAPLAGDDVCRIVFSSGSTGTPKGVEFTVDMLLARTKAARQNWMPVDPFMNLLGRDTVSGVLTFYWSVLSGATYLVASTATNNRTLLERYGVRSIKTSPSRLADLLAVGEGLSLEIVQVAGSLLTPSLGERARRVLGRTPVYLYGATEVGTVASGPFDAAQPHVVGRLLPGADVGLVDAAGQPVTDPGVEGVVRLRSAAMASHYWLDAADAASAFRDGWFYPGDLGSISTDGRLQLSGRANDVVNASGAKFNLAELDIWLSELRLFTDVASFSFSTDSGVAVGIAFVAKSHVGQELVTRQLAARFPNLAVSALVKLDEIPRNALGKVDRAALAAILQ